MDTASAFRKNGFAVLPAVYTEQEIDLVHSLIAKRKTEHPMHVSVDLLDVPGAQRSALGLLSERELETRHYKINDLYLDMEGVRQVALSGKLIPLLKRMLGDVPVLCNSLYMDRGTTQGDHVDSLYMTPQTPGHLIAAWVALEDAHQDAGQLEYYPGSHLFEQMKFSNGGYHFIPEEMDQWVRYINAKVAEARLVKKSFAAKKGDVFIWHANLLHAGGPIKDWSRTRKSLVFHYYSIYDCKRMNWRTQPANDAFWLDREYLSTPASGDADYSEDAYLDRYPDVAEAVKAGEFSSGRHHFEDYGKQEGRVGRRSVE